MQDNMELPEYVEMKRIEELTKPTPTNLDELKSKFDLMLELDKAAKKLYDMGNEGAYLAFNNNHRGISYITNFCSGLKSEIQNNRMSCTEEQFINEAFPKYAKKIFDASKNKPGISVSAVFIEDSIDTLKQTLEKYKVDEHLNSYMVQFDRSFKYCKDYISDRVENPKSPLNHIMHDENAKEHIISKSTLEHDEALIVLQEAYEISKENNRHLTENFLNFANQLDGNNTKAQKDRVEKFYKELPEDERKCFTYSEGAGLEFIGGKDLEQGKTILEKYTFKPSPEVKNNLIRIVNKMTEYGMFQKNISGEDGKEKKYAFRNYTKLKEEISNETDPAILKEKIGAFNTERRHIREIMTMCREAFGNGPWPGNVDVARNGKIEAEFAFDIESSSWMNGLFILNSELHTNNQRIEDYVENPAASIIKQMQEGIKLSCIPDANKMNHKEAFNHLLYLPKSKGAYSFMGVGRSYDIVTIADYMNPTGLIESGIIMGVNMAVSNITSSKFFEEYANNNNYERLSAFLLLDKPQDGDYLNMMYGYVNPITGEHLSFNPESYIKTHEIDYDKLQTRFLEDISCLERNGRRTPLIQNMAENFAKLSKTLIDNKVTPEKLGFFTRISKVRNGSELLAVQRNYQYGADRRKEALEGLELSGRNLEMMQPNEIKDIFKDMKEVLNSANPFYMKMRNTFSKGPYSQIIVEINNTLKSDFTDLDNVKASLLNIRKLSEVYIDEKMGKSEHSELEDRRVRKALTISEYCKKIINKTNNILEDNIDSEFLNVRQVSEVRNEEIEANLNKEINNDFNLDQNKAEEPVIEDIINTDSRQ